MRVATHAVLLLALSGFVSAQAGITRYVGKVRELVWQNPKVYIAFDVKQTDGTTDQYRLNCGSPADAMRSGLNRNSVKQGDTITVEVNEDRASRNYGQTVATLSDGRKIRDCLLE